MIQVTKIKLLICLKPQVYYQSANSGSRRSSRKIEAIPSQSNTGRPSTTLSSHVQSINIVNEVDDKDDDDEYESGGNIAYNLKLKTNIFC